MMIGTEKKGGGVQKVTVISTIALCALLAACGKGVDAKLATTDERNYRISLNAAWKDMDTKQQDAFNWAVSNLSLDDFVVKYPGATPRMVITQEADEYIKEKTQEVAATSAELAKNAARLAKEEKMVRDVDAELAKISATGVGIKTDSFMNDKRLIFITKNDSQYNISSASWDVWLFIDGEKRSDRKCRISAYYKIDGGMPRGKSVKYSADVGSMNCEKWNTLEVENAKSKEFMFELDKDSVEDFADKNIRPQFSPTRDMYVNKIKEAKAEIQTALKAKAALD